MDKHPHSEEELLAHAAWVQGVVRAMVRDEHLAEDLVQDALEAGLRTGPERIRNPRSWLLGVVRNLHRQDARAGTRRRATEARKPVPRDPPTSEELLARLEVQQIVARAVMDLPDPYRSVLILRHYEGAPVRRIAAARDVDRRKVETQLRRGHELLRKGLKAKLGKAWVVAVLPLSIPAAATAGVGLVVTGILAPQLWVAAGVLAAAGWGLWGWTRSDSEESASMTAEVEVQAGGSNDALDVHTASESTDQHSGTPSVTREEVSVASPTDDQIGWQPVGTYMPDYLEDDALLVQAVDPLDGKPLAGVTGYFYPGDPRSEPRALSVREEYPDEVDYLPRIGDPYRSDAKGLFHLPPPEHTCRIGVYPEGRFGWITVNSGSHDEVVVLPVGRVLHLTVEVVDESGAPVEAMPLALDSDGRMIQSERAMTDARGRYTFRHFQLSLARVTPEPEVKIVLGTLASPRVQETVSLRTPPTGVIRMTCPSTGALEFLLLDADGRPSPGADEAFLRIRPSARRSGSGEWVQLQGDWIASDADQLWGEAADDVVRFEHIAPGQQYDYEVRRPWPRTRETGSVMGPAAAGETVVVELRRQDALAALSGHLVRAGGAALAGVDARRAFVGLEPAYWVERGFVTDDSGAFRIGLDDRELTPGLDRCLLVSVASPEASWRRLIGELVCPSPTDGESLEVGTVEVGGEVIVGGRVVDEAGIPIPFAMVSLRWSCTTLGAQDREVSFIPYPRPQPEVVWTGPDGRFEFRGEVSGTDFELNIGAEGYLGLKMDLEPGRNDWEIPLPEAVHVEFEVILPDGVEPADVRVWTVADERPGPEGSAAQRSGSWNLQPGRNRIESLSAGHRELEFVDAKTGLVLATVDGLTPGSDGWIRDERLLPLDLRGRIHRFELEVLDELGKPVPTIWVRGIPGRDFGVRITDGVFLGGVARLEVGVGAAGLRTRDVDLVAGILNRVALEPGVPVDFDLTLDGLPRCPLPEFRVSLTSKEAMATSNAIIKPESLTTIRAGAPADDYRWTLAIRWREGEELETGWVRVPDFPPSAVTVEDGSPSTVRISISAAALDQEYAAQRRRSGLKD